MAGRYAARRCTWSRGRHGGSRLRRSRLDPLKALLAPTLLGAALLGVGPLAHPAIAATNYYVATTGSDSNDCLSAGSPCLTIAGAITKAAGGDTVLVAAGTYVGTDTHISKAVTIDGAVGGAGTPTTILDANGLGTATLWIESSNVTLKDLAVTNGYQGVRFGDAMDTPMTVGNTTLSNLTISGNAFCGVEVHNQVTASNLLVTGSRISGGLEGIRFASTAVGLGVTVQNSVFGSLATNSDSHIYQEGAGPIPGYIDGLTITGNTFGGTVGYSAIYSENITNVTISNNVFTLAGLGFVSYAWQPGTVGGFTIVNNTFTDLNGAAIVLAPDQPLDRRVDITRNTFSQDVAAVDGGSTPAVIRIQLPAGQTHAPVAISNNSLKLTRSGTPASSGQYGVRLSGDYAGVSIVGNSFDGGGVSEKVGASLTPRSAAIYVRTNDADYGAPSAGSALDIRNNRVTGFVDGITFYDHVAAAYGGLPAGNAVTIVSNAIAGNSGYGVRNGDPAASVSATGNWWGCAAGPGNPGCDAVVGSVATTSPLSSSTSAPFSPGFWPLPAPSATISQPVTTTPDAPPVVAQYDAPPGSPDVSVKVDFGAITGSGNVNIVPTSAPSTGSIGFGINPVINISFTGTFTPPVEICLSYDDSTFPPGVTPALWHYTDGAWSELETSRLDETNQVICGLTDSFSEFGVGYGIDSVDVCTIVGRTLTIDLSSDGGVTLRREGRSLVIEAADPDTCSTSPVLLGSRTRGGITTLVINGAGGDETVTFLDAGSRNWGRNSVRELLRTVDLGGESGDLVILMGTGRSDDINAPVFVSLLGGESVRIEGGEGSDRLTGGPNDDLLLGGGGNDRLWGGAGNDELDGGAGRNQLDGGLGTADRCINTGGTHQGRYPRGCELLI